MPAGYVIAQIEVTDRQAYAACVQAVNATVSRHGGEYLVRGGPAEVVEGNAAGGRIVVIRFPNMEAACDWYHGPDYAPVRALRQAASTSVQILAEGV